MAGFDNDVLYADNVDFSGGSPVTGKITANGQLLIGSSVAPHIRVGSLTSTDGSLAITNSAGGINLAVAAAPSSLQFTTDSGNATPAADVITIAGGTGIDTSGAGSTVTVTFDVTEVTSIPTSIGTDGGTATPAANAISIVGGEGIDTSAAGSVITVSGEDATSGNKGIASFDSGDFTVTAGNVTLNTTGAIQTLTGDSGGALSPTAGNFNILGGTNGIDTSGSGSTLTLNFDVTETGCITTVNGDSGTAVATANAISIVGAGTVTTSSTGSTVTITGAAGSSFTWNEETGASVNAVVSNGYITNRGGGVTVNLPGTFAVGNIVRILGKAGLWIVDAPAGDTIVMGDSTSTAGGTLTATNAGDAVELIGIIANDTWRVASSMGNITIA